MIDTYTLQVINVLVNISGTIATVLLLCMIYQLNKSQQDRADQAALAVEEVRLREAEKASKVETVKERLVVTTDAEAKDNTLKELQTISDNRGNTAVS